MLKTVPDVESKILMRVIAPERPFMSNDAATSILALAFSERDQDRMRELAAKARAGELSEAERAEADSYERVGSVLGILHSKARISRKNGHTDPR